MSSKKVTAAKKTMSKKVTNVLPETADSRKTCRPYQERAFAQISNELDRNEKCLVKMFCGTGKSLVMRRSPILQPLNNLVYVFPSLALISQFYTDYLMFGSKTCDPEDYVMEESVLKVSCEDDATTDKDTIIRFIIYRF
jgi:predicted helicase